MFILALDPSLNHYGYAILFFNKTSGQVYMKLTRCIVFKQSLALSLKLRYIYRVTSLISRGIDYVFLEDIFLHLNPKTLIALSMARAAFILGLGNTPYSFLTPREARALMFKMNKKPPIDKKFVHRLISLLFKPCKTMAYDESDAVLIGLAGLKKGALN